MTGCLEADFLVHRTGHLCRIQGGMREPYVLDVSMVLPLPLERVFSFFADARNLEAITPKSLRFQIVTPMPVEMKAGLMIDYRIRLRGLPMRWRSEITEYDRPRRFVDEQRRGPYKLWRHEHYFESVTDPSGVQGTRVRDHVSYIPRGGAIVHRLFVRPELERIFAYRQDAIRRAIMAQK